MNTAIIRTHINKDFPDFPDKKKFLGKKVEIHIREISDNTDTRKWNMSGAIDLHGVLDNVDIRRAAYE